MKRYFFEIAYDGTGFHGWQIQNNAHTIQEEFEKALQTLTGEKIETVGCGRTDTGVHARQFYLHADISPGLIHSELVYKLNRILPQSIAVFRMMEVEASAHARFDATSRTYKYYLHTRKDPFLQQYSVYLFNEVDVNKMNEAAEVLFNHTDFTSFSKLHTDNRTNNCKITWARWEKINHQLVFTIEADRFLRNMVRAIVGTLLEVGKGKLSSEEFENIIIKKDRGEAGESVPACGLYLQKISYPYIDPIDR